MKTERGCLAALLLQQSAYPSIQFVIKNNFMIGLGNLANHVCDGTLSNFISRNMRTFLSFLLLPPHGLVLKSLPRVQFFASCMNAVFCYTDQRVGWSYIIVSGFTCLSMAS